MGSAVRKPHARFNLAKAGELRGEPVCHPMIFGDLARSQVSFGAGRPRRLSWPRHRVFNPMCAELERLKGDPKVEGPNPKVGVSQSLVTGLQVLNHRVPHERHLLRVQPVYEQGRSMARLETRTLAAPLAKTTGDVQFQLTIVVRDGSPIPGALGRMLASSSSD